MHYSSFKYLALLLMLTLSFGCSQLKFNAKQSFSIAEKQYKQQNELLPVADKYPRTVKNGKLVATKLNDWTEGFFPGCFWYIYENNHDFEWQKMALKWTLPMEKLQYVTSHHDIGFLMYCSYGNAYRLAKDEKYKDVLVQSAKSLSTRFSEKTGCIKSWNYRESWDKKYKWYYPVIIDNMMNLELLYYATQVTGDKSYADIATKHAETTAKNHFRPDFSSYHVVNYDPNTGKVLFRGTCQGFSDSSTWARGQSWAIYGFTMVYRFTKRKEFLDLAKNLADFWLKNPDLPKDGIPNWDFNAGKKGHLPAQWADLRPAPAIQPRDASAAAITCSALFELSSYLNNDKKYYNAAVKILKSLSSPAYLAKPGENGNFMLKHNVGSLPHGAEIDVPLVYADYYFLEALNRYNNYSSLANFINKPFLNPTSK